MSRWVSSMGAVLAFAVLASGCAMGPRYQTVKRYVPPEGAAARLCLDKCAAAMERCQGECEERYRACAKSVLPDAQARHAELLKHYEAALAQYRWELERYRMDLMLGWGYGYPYWDPWGWYPSFPPPFPPVAPSLEREVARLTQQRCDRDCGCQSAYEACFLACGGAILHETQCIANCPEPKK